jgi:hypothetical protein
MGNILNLLSKFTKRFFLFYAIYAIFSYGVSALLGTEYNTSKPIAMGALISIVSIIYEWAQPRFFNKKD